MPRKGFVLAYDPNGVRREVPEHYLDQFGYRRTKPPVNDAAKSEDAPADTAAGAGKKGK
ncbi:hypothetical protein [Zhihengliuella sp.]|uniref:hypothetical protein n=1 Tax=Zhihengliuella sp. TaxID=1954483 RepID=UPI0028125070|nr:hypothetical protein [Zhihengliuella sp.]